MKDYNMHPFFVKRFVDFSFEFFTQQLFCKEFA